MAHGKEAARTDAHDDHDADDGMVHSHVSSVKFYVGILAILIMFTLLTVGMASIHLGPLNLAVAIAIASAKATLVVMFFMHLRYDNRFNATIVICSLMFIGVFFAYTMNDTDMRGELDDAQGSMVLPSTGQQAPGGLPGMASGTGPRADRLVLRAGLGRSRTRSRRSLGDAGRGSPAAGEVPMHK